MNDPSGDTSTGIGWLLVGFGLLIVGFGVVWLMAPSVPWLGRLPGDIRVETETTRVYVPLTTCLLLSVLLSLGLWVIRWLRGP